MSNLGKYSGLVNAITWGTNAGERKMSQAIALDRNNLAREGFEFRKKQYADQQRGIDAKNREQDLNVSLLSYLKANPNADLGEFVRKHPEYKGAVNRYRAGEFLRGNGGSRGKTAGGKTAGGRAATGKTVTGVAPVDQPGGKLYGKTAKALYDIEEKIATEKGKLGKDDLTEAEKTAIQTRIGILRKRAGAIKADVAARSGKVWDPKTKTYVAPAPVVDAKAEVPKSPTDRMSDKGVEKVEGAIGGSAADKVAASESEKWDSSSYDSVDSEVGRAESDVEMRRPEIPWTGDVDRQIKEHVDGAVPGAAKPALRGESPIREWYKRKGAVREDGTLDPEKIVYKMRDDDGTVLEPEREARERAWVKRYNELVGERNRLTGPAREKAVADLEAWKRERLGKLGEAREWNRKRRVADRLAFNERKGKYDADLQAAVESDLKRRDVMRRLGIGMINGKYVYNGPIKNKYLKRSRRYTRDELLKALRNSEGSEPVKKTESVKKTEPVESPGEVSRKWNDKVQRVMTEGSRKDDEYYNKAADVVEKSSVADPEFDDTVGAITREILSVPVLRDIVTAGIGSGSEVYPRVLDGADVKSLEHLRDWMNRERLAWRRSGKKGMWQPSDGLRDAMKNWRKIRERDRKMRERVKKVPGRMSRERVYSPY